MRKLSLLLAALIVGSATVWADSVPRGVSATSHSVWTQTVFNDSGGTIASGWVVVWDNDDTEFDRNGYPYVTTTTSADNDWVAGVVVDGMTCPNQSLCEIVVYGPTITLMAESTDASTEDQTVATTTIAGMAGDWGATANTCYLGLFMEDRDVDSGGASVLDGQRSWVFVRPGCED